MNDKQMLQNKSSNVVCLIESLNKLLLLNTTQIKNIIDKTKSKIESKFDIMLLDDINMEIYLNSYWDIIYAISKMTSLVEILRLYSKNNDVLNDINLYFNLIRNIDDNVHKSVKLHNKNKETITMIKNKESEEYAILNMMNIKQLSLGITNNHITTLNTKISSCIMKHNSAPEKSLKLKNDIHDKNTIISNNIVNEYITSIYKKNKILRQNGDFNELLINMFKDASIIDIVKLFVKKFDVGQICEEFIASNNNSCVNYDAIKEMFDNMKKKTDGSVHIDFDELLNKIINVCSVFFKIKIIKNKNCKIGKNNVVTFNIYDKKELIGFFIVDKNIDITNNEIILLDWSSSDNTTYPTILYLLKCCQEFEYTAILNIFNDMCNVIKYILSERKSKYCILNSLNTQSSEILNKIFRQFLCQSDVMKYIFGCKNNIIKKSQILVYLSDLQKIIADIVLSLQEHVINQHIDDKYSDSYLDMNDINSEICNYFENINCSSINKVLFKSMFYDNNILWQHNMYSNNINKIIHNIVSFDIYNNCLDNACKLLDINISTNVVELVKNMLGREVNYDKYIHYLAMNIETILDNVVQNDNFADVYKLFSKSTKKSR